MSDEVRLDRWLWAARFFKTRGQATDAIEGGKVHLNGSRAKKSKSVKRGDSIRIRKPPYEYLLVVTDLSEKRGPPAAARGLYEETDDSIAARELMREQIRAQPRYEFHEKGKPSKKERREIGKLKRKL